MGADCLKNERLNRKPGFVLNDDLSRLYVAV